MLNFNMLTDPVFPVVGRSGARRWVCFVDLLAETEDYPAAFDWPRGDLNVASLELAIGLLALVFEPSTPDEWRFIWRGADGIDVAAKIARLAPSFNLFGDADGKGPRFCQDFDDLDGEPNPVEALFIDTPGANGQKKNSDLMTHRERFPALGLAAAAMALYALQQFAPSGGAGNRTSMRGGGPMTTLVLPRAKPGEPPVPLLRLLLLNLPLVFRGRDGALPESEMDRALPWLRPTMTSDGKPPREIHDADPAVHPVQALFGMPRRIRLVSGGNGVCALTGREGPVVTGFVQKPWGTNYGHWRHPLTPYRQSKEDPAYTVKPKPGRFGYRDWVGVTIGLQDKALKAFPAEAVMQCLTSRRREFKAKNWDAGLLAAGWAMNNMEAEQYLESVQPLHLPTADDAEFVVAEIEQTARQFAEAAEAAARLLRGALDEALFGGQAKATDTGLFEEATDAFYARTEDAFHDTLARIAQDAGEAGPDPDRARSWLGTIRRAALSLFDELATERLAAADVREADRITRAYGQLFGALTDRSRIAAALGVVPKPKPEPAEGDHQPAPEGA